MAQVISTQNTHHHYTESGEHIVSKDVGVARIGTWLKQGWMDIAHAPLASLFYGVLMAFTVYAVHAVFKNEPLMLFNLSTFFIMLTPFLATGLYAISINLSKGQKPDLSHSMFAWRKNTTEFALFALVLGIVIAIWGRITPLIAAIVKSNSLLIVNPDMGVMGFIASDSGMTFMVYFLIGAAFVSAFVFAISVVTIPLLLRDNKVGVISAMVLSFKVAMENKLTMAVWAVLIASLITLGLVTLGLAMIVVMPLLGYASWHAFNDLIEVDD
ncbi:DUF2189 domain-containing protein [Thiomicrorhabdus sp.]|uniref:DUF2189 domain-containing protein n=1 Tax=Thiomicrorhabdus sp. TaxID=2039724 RepID=UPI002AA91A1B|nr:DUF2189 domain-containing protein [Thiomicrorhabdus sp.]